MKTIDQLANNCTLVAVRELTGASDEDVIQAFLAHGYVRGRGTHSCTYLNALRDLGLVALEVDVKIEGRSAWNDRMTLGMFCRTYTRGVYLVKVSHHAFVVRDGIVVDPNVSGKKLRRRVIQAWSVPGAAASRYLAKNAHKIKRGSDPLVYFHGPSHRHSGNSLRKENQAGLYIIQHGEWTETPHGLLKTVRLSEILSNTDYDRRDVAFDLKRGRLVPLDK